MPHYVWRGVDLQASYQQGRAFARSPKELEVVLRARDIALISHYRPRWQIFVRSVPLHIKIDFFKQLALLLKAGLLLPKALHILVMQTPNRYLSELIYALHAQVQEGYSLGLAMKDYSDVFSPVMVRMITVGEQTGSLSVSLEALADYLASLENFAKKVKSVLLLPFITLGLFALLSILLLVVIVPQFRELFQGLTQDVPWITQTLFTTSDIVRSWWFFPGIIVSICAGCMIFRALNLSHNKRWFDEGVMQFPQIGSILKDITIMHTAHSLALLLNGGMHMVPALHMTAPIISNEVMKNSFGHVIQAVQDGLPLHSALEKYGELFANKELCSLLAVGHESGNVTNMLTNIAVMYQEKIERRLHMVTLLVQPILMIVLGLLIMLVLIALYAPLFTLAHHV